MADASILPLGTLLPCPFCGSSAEFYTDGDMEGHSVMCSGDKAAADDPCPLHTFGFSSMTDAQAAWNRRAKTGDTNA